MKNRITVALGLLVDLKINEGVDISEIKEIINGLECSCVDTFGKDGVMGVDMCWFVGEPQITSLPYSHIRC